MRTYCFVTQKYWRSDVTLVVYTKSGHEEVIQYIKRHHFDIGDVRDILTYELGSYKCQF